MACTVADIVKEQKNPIDSILYRCVKDGDFVEQLQLAPKEALSEYKLSRGEENIFLEKGKELQAKLFGGDENKPRLAIVVVVIIVIDDFQHPHKTTDGLLESFAESFTNNRYSFREYIDNLEQPKRLSVLKQMMSIIQK